MLRVGILASLLAALVFTAAPAWAQGELGDGLQLPGPGEPGYVEVVVEDATVGEIAPEDAIPAAVFLRIDFDDAALTGGDADDRLNDLFEFYDARLYQPIWVSAEGANDRARALISALLDSEVDALKPGNYDIGTISLLLGVTTPTALADFEIRLSKALLEYGRDLSEGRVEPSEVNSDISIFPEGPSAAQLLTGVLNAASPEDYLASLAPQTPNYARLREKLAEYRAIVLLGGWTQVPDDEVLKPGMSQPRVAILRERLTESGHYVAPEVAAPIAGDTGKGDAPVAQGAGGVPVPVQAPVAEVYDEPLVAAVKLFQERHGLDVDGVVGPGTLAALNVSAEQRVRQMEINMERRRWMADDLGEEYVFVNLADFELKVVFGDQTVHTARVVIGKPYHSTPVFSDVMEYVEINPYWNVPASIARNELLPKLIADPGSLARDGIRVLQNGNEVNPYSVNWAAYSGRNIPFRLRQDPGNGNALGRIKFMFPNQFNVYLHDTPSKSLFERTVRSFSHGCVRVQHPFDLATWLLSSQPGWSRPEIDAAVASGQRQVVRLDHAIDVHITYLTAWVNKDGSVHFRDDVYGRDEVLSSALERANLTRLDG